MPARAHARSSAASTSPTGLHPVRGGDWPAHEATTGTGGTANSVVPSRSIRRGWLAQPERPQPKDGTAAEQPSPLECADGDGENLPDCLQPRRCRVHDTSTRKKRRQVRDALDLLQAQVGVVAIAFPAPVRTVTGHGHRFPAAPRRIRLRIGGGRWRFVDKIVLSSSESRRVCPPVTSNAASVVSARE